MRGQAVAGHGGERGEARVDGEHRQHAGVGHAVQVRVPLPHRLVLAGEVIGVDDWAYKRRNNYGTIVCDSQTHKPIALLDGRDGTKLKKWLEQNKHVKTVTRDRASGYAKAIKDALPDAIQVADRFHLVGQRIC